MNTLIIDCSSGLNVIILTPNNKFEYFDSDAKKQSDSLLDKIDQLLKTAGLKITDISVVAVGIGPGSFTGIRVALATAKGLAIGQKTKVVTFNSFEAVVCGISERNYGVITEGFGNNYYYYFKKFGKVFQGCATPDKLTVLAKDINIYSASSIVCDKITEFSVTPAVYDAPKCVKQKIENSMFVDTNKIVPLYLRASQAELERLKNGNKI